MSTAMEQHLARAVVVLSGGQDSMTCLALALREAKDVHCITFDYGQRHRVEIEQAELICRLWGAVSHRIVDLSRVLPQLVTSALTTPGRSVAEPHERLKNLPASFVPARNALFLTLAHALACELDASAVYAGMCSTDYSGYPDCRRPFIRGINRALNEGYEASVDIRTPLMYLTKAETFRLAEQLGVLDDVVEHSHTCYEGDHATRHEWGFGCGKCPACVLRKNGYFEAFPTLSSRMR